MSKTRRVLTTEFKQECVNLVVNQGYTMSQAASAMQVGLSSMQRWTSQYKQEVLGVTPLARALTPEQQRIQALESEVKQLRRDNDLLKKASAFFAIEMQASNKSSRSN
jgi:transposase